MTPTLSHFYLARVTLETLTPLSIAAGGADGVFDMQLARDANGLPTLPGSTIAGVLKHLYRRVYGDDERAANRLFGFQSRDKGDASRLHVSWGAIQDSTGEPVEGLLLGEQGRKRLADKLLETISRDANRETRDRVRIGHRGAAADTGKFDRVVLPAGHRFSAELSLWSERAADPNWMRVLGLLAHPLFRLGGGTRAGLGRLAMVDLHQGGWDLTTDAGRQAYAKLPRGLGETAGLQPHTPAAEETPHLVSGTLTLKPRGFWRIGEGEGGPKHKVDPDGKPADLLPKLEARWDWDAKAPKATELLVPASSLKGLLAHRVAFHANRRAGRWAQPVLSAEPGYDKSEHCPEVRELFGYARDDRDDDKRGPKGQVGRVLIDDGYLTLAADALKIMMHNAIDRFTGGVREHMLFSEELVWKGEVRLALVIDTRGLSGAARTAFGDALADLCAGRVAIGGGAGKGHGFCDGKIHWSDGGAWLADAGGGSGQDTPQNKPKQEAA